MREILCEGVGAVVLFGDNVLTLKEKQDKPYANKLAGMRSIPMETLESGESHEQGMHRLHIQEGRPSLNGHGPLGIYLGDILIAPGVPLHAYLQEAISPDLIPGSEQDEVGDYNWTPVNELLSIKPGDLSWRPGAVEALELALKARSSNGEYQPAYVDRPRSTLPHLIWE